MKGVCVFQGCLSRPNDGHCRPLQHTLPHSASSGIRFGRAQGRQADVRCNLVLMDRCCSEVERCCASDSCTDPSSRCAFSRADVHSLSCFNLSLSATSWSSSLATKLEAPPPMLCLGNRSTYSLQLVQLSHWQALSGASAAQLKHQGGGGQCINNARYSSKARISATELLLLARACAGTASAGTTAWHHYVVYS